MFDNIDDELLQRIEHRKIEKRDRLDGNEEGKMQMNVYHNFLTDLHVLESNDFMKKWC
jgi:hypothetical protein